MGFRIVPAILQSAVLQTTPVMPGFARGFYAFVRLGQHPQRPGREAGHFAS